jgi:hypothetical protein
MKNPLLALAIALCAAVTSVQAAVVLQASGATAHPAIAAAAPSSDAPLQLAVAQAQLKELRDFQASMLSTVYWSLGAMATVVSVLAGFGWFVNVRLYDRDKAALDRDLRATIAEHVASLKDDSRRVQDTLAAHLKSSADEQSHALEARMLASTQERLSSLEKALLKEIAASKAFSERQAATLLEVRIRLEKSDRQEALDSGVLGNALQASVSVLELALETGQDYYVADALDLVKKDIDTIVAAGKSPIDSWLHGELIGALDRVRGKNANAASVLKRSAEQLLK